MRAAFTFAEGRPACTTTQVAAKAAFTLAEGRPACTTTQVAAKAAFTLAEVLITLAVIGIVAAITMPALVQKYQEKARVTALKKFYSVINQAVQMAVIEHGTPDMWGITEEDSSPMLTNIIPYLKHAKLCGGDGKKCHSAYNLTRRNGGTISVVIFNGRETDGRYGLQLGDGMIVGTYVVRGGGVTSCDISLGTGMANKICGEYMVDVNGSAAPNTYGKDIFIFNLTKNGTVIPVGTRIYSSEGSHYAFDSGCLDESSDGWACAGWVIENGNMDYWHCSDLAWDGKHKCSD